MTNLFVYGTLTFPEVVFALVGKNFKSKPAQLTDYFVVSLSGLACPGLIAQKGSVAKGLVLVDVDKKSLQAIDDWEHEGYVTKQVSVLCEGKKIIATAYVWIHPIDKITSWDKDKFRNHSLDRYLEIEIPEYQKKRHI